MTKQKDKNLLLPLPKREEECHVVSMSSCCPPQETEASPSQKKRDVILWGSVGAIALAFLLTLFNHSGLATTPIPFADTFTTTTIEFLRTMWWGVGIGILFIGFMNKIPKEYFNAVLGRGDSFGGILRATIAGLLLDLCNHGILMIGAKLYERGASLAQVMAFLIASPWNSISLTMVLFALIGFKWTMLFVLGSALIAMITGLIYQALIRAKILPDNPNTVDMPSDFNLKTDIKARLKNFKPDASFFKDILWDGVKEAKMLIRWLLLGVLIAAAIRTFIPMEIFGAWFGPTAIGLTMTLIVATVMEVCSEGSAPIASELLHNAAAPGNAFAFLMAGVATDYTEIMIIREATKSWIVALSLPLITVPQIVLLSVIINMAAGS